MTQLARERSCVLVDLKTLHLAPTNDIHLQTLIEAAEMVKTIKLIELLEILGALEGDEIIAALKESQCGVGRGEVSGPISKGIPNHLRKCGLYLSAHHRRFRLTVISST